jgi:hypothetical protein
MVPSRLDHFNCILFGLPASSIRRLRTIQNAAVHLVVNIRRSDHVTDELVCLHWARVGQRIRFKMVVMAFRSIHTCRHLTYMGSYRIGLNVLGCVR